MDPFAEEMAMITGAADATTAAANAAAAAEASEKEAKLCQVRRDLFESLSIYGFVFGITIYMYEYVRVLHVSQMAQTAYLERRFGAAAGFLETLSNLGSELSSYPSLKVNVALVKQAKGELDTPGFRDELQRIYDAASDVGDFDEAEHAPLIFNLSLAYFLRRQFVKSEQLLRKVGLLLTFLRKS